MLDFDFAISAAADLQTSFTNASPPLPLVPGPGFIARAEADFHSLFLRNPQPDCPPATALGLPREPVGPPPAPPSAAAIIAAHLPPLKPGMAYEPLYIPPEVITKSMTSALSFTVTVPGGEEKTVYMLNAPVTHSGALLKQPYTIEPTVTEAAVSISADAVAELAAPAVDGPPPPRRSTVRAEADRTRRVARTRELHSIYKKAGEPSKLLEERCGSMKPQVAYRKLEDWESNSDNTVEGTMTVGDIVVATLKGVFLPLMLHFASTFTRWHVWILYAARACFF
jgi:hypothetical protein